MSRTKKQIAFDIDTNVAKQILGTNYTKVYDDIKRFAKKKFTHIQGSVYVSRKSMTIPSVSIFISDLLKQYPYIEKCVRDMTVTSVSKNTSLNVYFSYDGTAGQYKKFNVPLPPKKQAVKDWLRKNITFDELAELINKGVPLHSKKVGKDDFLIIFEKRFQPQVDKILDDFKQKNSQQQNNNPRPKR